MLPQQPSSSDIYERLHYFEILSFPLLKVISPHSNSREGGYIAEEDIGK